MAETIKILVGDKLASKGLDFLNSFDQVDVDVKTGLSEDELAQIIGAYDGLIVRSGVQVTAKVLEKPGKLRAIARAGVGVDNIDLAAATARGVLVMNSAEASTITTAEHAFALLMALARNIGPAYKTVTEGGWDRSKFVGTQLSGKTLGVVGFGRIGRTVAERALAFGMNVVAFDPVYNAQTALDGRVRMFKSFEKMVGECDILSFHVPLNDATRGMLNDQTFASCRDGVMVINAARGGVVDVEALIRALDAGKCGGAAIDVYESEPPADDDPLRTHPKVLATPHLGASTAEAQEAVSTDACAQMLEYLRGEGLRGAVNLGGVRMDLDPAQSRYIDLAKRMARLIGPMCEGGFSDVTVTADGESLRSIASTMERLVMVELLRTMLDVPVNVVNVKLIAEQRGIKARTTMIEEARHSPRVTVEVAPGSENGGGKPGRIVGSVFADGQPRILEINGYRMDMVPAGPMLVLQNEDRPGMVGIVGGALGEAGLNIADMALSRRDGKALMVLNVDQVADAATLKQLRTKPGIVKVLAVAMPPLENERE